jgi:hypothetical protein
MLDREQYYTLDTVERAMAEVMITKHRNGPTGAIKLLFQSDPTKFENLAKFKDFSLKEELINLIKSKQRDCSLIIDFSKISKN